MEWRDQAIVLFATRHGEADALLDVLTHSHGRARGFIKGGLSRRNKANLQAGNRLSVVWRARLEENLGRFTVELLHSPLGQMLGDGGRLAALSAVTSVVAASMPERESYVGVFDGLAAIVELFEHEDGTSEVWGAALARLELGILKELGYSLDLNVCAATGATDNLIYVSPKSGRAVSAAGGAPYKEKLLALPQFLLDGTSAASREDVIAALRLTGFFLDRNIWMVRGKGQPAARERLVSSLLKSQESAN